MLNGPIITHFLGSQKGVSSAVPLKKYPNKAMFLRNILHMGCVNRPKLRNCPIKTQALKKMRIFVFDFLGKKLSDPWDLSMLHTVGDKLNHLYSFSQKGGDLSINMQNFSI